MQELAYVARICVAEGARSIHLHPRDTEGFERLDAEIVDHVVMVVKDACGMPVGVNTGPSVEPDLDWRTELIQSWQAPDFAIVDFSEPGAARVMRACLQAGIAVEAGVTSVEDVETLAVSGLGSQVLRTVIGPVEVSAAGSLAVVDDIHAALDRFGLRAPRMQFGDGEVAWVLLADAVRRGCDTRIGLENTIYGPDGDMVEGNAGLVRAATRRGASGI